MFQVQRKPKKVKATVRRFDFSSHSGSTELLDMVENIKGNPKILAVHGEEEQSLGFAKQVTEKFSHEALAPRAGDVIEI